MGDGNGETEPSRIEIVQHEKREREIIGECVQHSRFAPWQQTKGAFVPLVSHSNEATPKL